MRLASGYRRAMLKAVIAIVKFLKWLKPAVQAGGQTELSVDRKLTSLRRQQPLFRRRRIFRWSLMA